MMTNYYANATVIYTDDQGNRFDTFVIFDTDTKTELTHINHENLKVRAGSLVLHEKTACRYHMPLDDAFSFEILKKLRDKYEVIDNKPKTSTGHIAKMRVLAEAS